LGIVDGAYLIDGIRKAADIEYATGRFPDSELLGYANQSILRLYTLLDRLDNTYYEKSFVFTTSNAVATYGLPNDFWNLKGVVVSLSTSQSVRARRYNPAESSDLDNNSVWNNSTYPIFYRLKGKNILFKPAPAGAYTVTLEYTPEPAKLQDTTSTVDFPVGFERWVVLDAAIKCKMKDSLDPGLLKSEKSELEEWITTLGSTRDAGEPDTVQDVQAIDVGRILADFW
jgi:hypothetical protein